MPKKRETGPKIHIDDLHPKNDGFVHAYIGTWQEAGVIATWELDVVDRDHWQPRHYRSLAYELLGSMRTVSGRPLGTLQEETGRLLLQELKERMLAAMIDAGWQQVDSTREGLAIYQYRPGPQLPGAKSEPAAQYDQPDLAITGVGEVAGRDQVSEVKAERGDAPVITIDDLNEPPMTMARKLQGLGPLSYHAKAEQNDVKASINLRHYQDYRYPGGYILDERTDRVNEFAPGSMGKKQAARAHALLDQLREQVQAALLVAGWERRWTTVHGKDLWLYVGTPNHPAADPEIREQDLPDIAIAGAGAEVPGEDQVREAEPASQNQENLLELGQAEQPEPEPRQSHIIEVIGGEEAKERGQQPAYSREVWTRPVTFTCIVCKQEVTQQRYPGNLPLYCSDFCKGERQRERTRERVALHRKKKAEAGNGPSQDGVTA